VKDEKNILNEKTEKNEISQKKNKYLWPIVFFIIALFSIWAVISQSKSFSFSTFVTYLKQVSWIWLIMAILALFLYIAIEGMAISSICKSLGYPVKRGHGIFYSAADIYFSAITPSATGGQPACAYFMMRDKIPGVIVTISLFLNVMMYTLSLVIIGIVSLLICPNLFFSFNLFFKILIILGIFFQFSIVILFYLLLYQDYFLERLLTRLIRFLSRIHLIKDANKKLDKLLQDMNYYRDKVKLLKGKNRVILKNLVFNLLQRCSQIAVVVFVFLATGGKINNVVQVWTIQSFVYLGAYCIPIPGAIGVTDYLMLHGFGKIMPTHLVTNFELLSRSLSFYLCIFVCGIATLIKYCIGKRSAVK